MKNLFGNFQPAWSIVVALTLCLRLPATKCPIRLSCFLYTMGVCESLGCLQAIAALQTKEAQCCARNN